MKIPTAIIAVFIAGLIGISACNSSKSSNANSNKIENKRVPLTTVDKAISYVEINFKNSEETLWIADSLNDEVGVNMAIIADKLLKAGYMPDGFEQKKGYRIYRYKKLK